MKRLFSFLSLLGLVVFQGCTGFNRPEPNYEGVLMQNCGKNGLADFSIVTGSQGILGPCSELYQVPRFEHRADLDPNKVVSKDGGVFQVDPSYMFKAIPGKGPEIVFNYKHAGVSDRDQLMSNIENTVLDPVVFNAYREEARTFTTDSLLKNFGAFEKQVEDRLKKEFEAKFFVLMELTSNLTPPKSMSESIERRNNKVQEAEMVKNDLEVARMQLEKAKIDMEANNIRTRGLSKEILLQQYIEAIRNSPNAKLIITDGKVPVIIGN